MVLRLLLNMFIELNHWNMYRYIVIITYKAWNSYFKLFHVNFQIKDIFTGKLGYESVQLKSIRYAGSFRLISSTSKIFPALPFDLSKINWEENFHRCLLSTVKIVFLDQ